MKDVPDPDPQSIDADALSADFGSGSDDEVLRASRKHAPQLKDKHEAKEWIWILVAKLIHFGNRDKSIQILNPLGWKYQLDGVVQSRNCTTYVAPRG